MKNEAIIKRIKVAVEAVAARAQDEWAFANGHRDQKWESISDEHLKEGWRWRVSVAEVIRELEEND